MPGFVKVTWNVDGTEREPETAFFEQTRFAQLTFRAEFLDQLGGEHEVTVVAEFDPPLEAALPPGIGADA